MDSAALLAQKLEHVRKLWLACQAQLKEDVTFQALLQEYLRAFRRTEEIAQEVGLAEYCARCGQRGKGSCCGEDMEFHCEDVLLLANLACGVSLPPERHLPYGCFFLGPQGCLLQVRPLICRNFVCPDAARFLGLEKLRLLQEGMGPEAEALFRLCEYVKGLCQTL